MKHLSSPARYRNAQPAESDEVQHVEREHRLTRKKSHRFRQEFAVLSFHYANSVLVKAYINLVIKKMRKLSMLLTMTIPKHRSGFNSCALCLMQTLFDIAPS